MSSTRRPPKKRRQAPRPRVADEEHERPTVNPPFDVAAYARATAGSDDPREVVSNKDQSPPPTERGRPSDGTSPEPGRNSNQARSEPDPPRALYAKTNWSEFPEESVSQQITLTNELALEQALARSVSHSEPPRHLSGGALSIANARAPSLAPPVETLPPSEGGAAPRGTAAPEITGRAIEDPIEEMRERFSLGDYSGALEMSELILGEDPGNLDAAECGENCRSVLESMYAARLGPLDRVPIVIVPNAQMRWLSMDHRAGFILSLIDGSSTLEMILDVSSMPRLDALRIVLDLAQQKIVSFQETRERPERHNVEKAKRK